MAGAILLTVGICAVVLALFAWAYIKVINWSLRQLAKEEQERIDRGHVTTAIHRYEETEEE